MLKIREILNTTLSFVQHIKEAYFWGNAILHCYVQFAPDPLKTYFTNNLIMF